MPFAEYEESRYLGDPVELFLIRYGTTPASYIAYTNAEQSVTYNGVEYLPEVINRASSVQSSGTLDKAKISVRVQIASRLAELFKVYPPSQPVSLIIFMGHLSDPTGEFKSIWSGKILTCQREGSECVFSCEPLITALRRTGLRRNYQVLCPHALYGPDCKASKEAAKITRPVVNFLNNAKTVFNLNDFWNPHPVESYVNGTVEWDSSAGREYRTILSIYDGKTFVLGGPLIEVQPGDNIDIYLGCNHHPGMTDPAGDCVNRHNNIQNYGGQVWIPFENPIGKNPFY